MSDFYEENGRMKPVYRENLLKVIETRSLDEIIETYARLLHEEPCRQEFKYILQLKIETERDAVLTWCDELQAQVDELTARLEPKPIPF